MKEMYKGIVNSPITSLLEDIGAKDTDIKVVDASYLPKAPNLAVIGTEGTAETIKYAGINENILTGCTRGFQGVAKAWDKDTLIARNFTEYDLAAVQENIQTLDSEKASNQEFKDFQGSIQEQLNEHEAQAEANLNNYAKKTELSAAETRLDKKIDAKVSTTTFEDFKNTNQTALDKKTNNTDFEVYKKEVTSNLAKKVDKVSGKGLSTNDYTDLEKAEVAKIKNLATSETVAGIKSEVETLKTSKVDKVVGKGLSTNDYDNTEKAEVAKIKDKADRTDLTKKIDKTDITSDLSGTSETLVLSQKAGNELKKMLEDNEVDIEEIIDIVAKTAYVDRIFSTESDLYKYMNRLYGIGLTNAIQTLNDLVNNSIAMKEVANNEIAMKEVANSSIAMKELKYSRNAKKYATNKGISGDFLLLEFSKENYLIIGAFKDGSEVPQKDYYRNLAPLGKFLQEYPKIITKASVDSDIDDWMLVYEL